MSYCCVFVCVALEDNPKHPDAAGDSLLASNWGSKFKSKNLEQCLIWTRHIHTSWAWILVSKKPQGNVIFRALKLSLFGMVWLFIPLWFVRTDIRYNFSVSSHCVVCLAAIFLQLFLFLCQKVSCSVFKSFLWRGEKANQWNTCQKTVY